MSEVSVDLKRQSKKIEVSGVHGHHSYTATEAEAFGDFINGQLQNDPALKSRLPINTAQELFDSVKDGVLLCKLVNKAQEGTIDERVINIKDKLNPWQISENHTLFLQSAISMGLKVVNAGPNDLMEGNATIVLGLVWQVVRAALLHDINLREHPELARLLEDGETLEDLLALPAEQLLIRWVNYHMKEAKSDRRIKNFTKDIQDSEVYTILLNQICPNNECSMAPMKESDLSERAEAMLKEADNIKCREFLTPKDIVKPNGRLNLAFVANLFNNYPALDPVKEEDYDFADLLEDGEGSREERQMRYWIQSLGIKEIEDNYPLQDLYHDLQDGVVLCLVMDAIKPGIVNWKHCKKNARNKFQKVANCNHYVECAKKVGFSTVNCGGADIYDKNRKLILGQTWQLMKLSTLQLLEKVGGGKKVSEADVLAWANKITNSNISSFKQKDLGDGVWLCKLCAAVSPRSVNKDLINDGGSDEDKDSNAQYAISVARAIGATTFLVREDIVEVNSKQLFAFCAALMLVALQKNE